MPVINSFRDLKVWQKAMQLVERVYRLSGQFPAGERFGLVSQMRRSAVSIPSNIGEGFRRRRRRVYVQLLETALGSQGELDVQLEIARRLEYCDEIEYRSLQTEVDAVGKMLNGLIASLEGKK
jgi:four helix bundle protein